MWRDGVRKRYFWLAIETDSNRLEEELVKAEEIEECDRYLFSLHMHDVQSLNVFDAPQQEEILGVLSTLINDAKKHCRILSRVRKTIERYKNRMERS